MPDSVSGRVSVQDGTYCNLKALIVRGCTHATQRFTALSALRRRCSFLYREGGGTGCVPSLLVKVTRFTGIPVRRKRHVCVRAHRGGSIGLLGSFFRTLSYLIFLSHSNCWGLKEGLWAHEHHSEGWKFYCIVGSSGELPELELEGR